MLEIDSILPLRVKEKSQTTRKCKKAGWYIQKPYQHFDLPISFEDAEKLVTCPESVARHSFYPFLAYDKSERSLKRVKTKGKSAQFGRGRTFVA